jgi:hypothetical protein
MRIRVTGETAPERVSDEGCFVQELLELFGQQRLGAIAQGFIGVVVHLDDEPIGPSGDPRERQRDHLRAYPRRMAGVHNDGKMRELLDTETAPTSRVNRK